VQFVLKFWKKIKRCSRSQCKLNGRGVWKTGERRILTHMWSIEWCRFQWSWVTPNPDFKVMPLFDAKYLRNGYRKRIGNHIQAFEWYNYQLPWVALNQDFKVTMFLMSNYSKMVQDKAILTMPDQYNDVYDLSIGTIFNQLMTPLTQISRLCQYSMNASASASNGTR